MTWTPNKPQVPGWYWWRSDFDAEPTIMWVRHTKDKYLYVTQVGGRELWIENIGGEWSSIPLAVPGEE